MNKEYLVARGSKGSFDWGIYYWHAIDKYDVQISYKGTASFQIGRFPCLLEAINRTMDAIEQYAQDFHIAA